ncbi:MAG TPA: hypothetical protein VFN56_01975 [Candidatus Saccharimonadales bacterium]|nr:hypothetical protein [Candidatus Saccharimonadales bacterium]
MLTHAHIMEAADQLAANKPIVLENGPVFAVVCNANDPQVQAKIKKAKDPHGLNTRGAHQPVGWTVPFAHALDTVDMSLITDERMRRLLADPSELTGRIGALAFLRAIADKRVKHKRNIPDSIIPDEAGAMVQIYTPTGNDSTHKIVRRSMALGVEPVMTSANVSHEKEIIDGERAIQFAHDAGGLAVYLQGRDTADTAVRGSYPILGVREDSFTLERAGCFGADIIARLLFDVPFQPFTAHGELPQPAKYPEYVLHLNDLPDAYSSYKGNDLWFGILATQGWHDELVDMAQEIPDVAPHFARPVERSDRFSRINLAATSAASE